MATLTAAQASGSKAQPESLGIRIRDSLALNESVIIACINDILGSMPNQQAEVFKRLLATSPHFGNSIKRVTLDIGVILSLAKSFESNEDFAASAALVHDIRFSDFDGKLGVYAKAMVSADLKMLSQYEAGVLEDDALLFGMVAPSVLRSRLTLLGTFMDHSMKQPA